MTHSMEAFIALFEGRSMEEVETKDVVAALNRAPVERLIEMLGVAMSQEFEDLLIPPFVSREELRTMRNPRLPPTDRSGDEEAASTSAVEERSRWIAGSRLIGGRRHSQPMRPSPRPTVEEEEDMVAVAAPRGWLRGKFIEKMRNFDRLLLMSTGLVLFDVDLIPIIGWRMSPIISNTGNARIPANLPPPEVIRERLVELMGIAEKSFDIRAHIRRYIRANLSSIAEIIYPLVGPFVADAHQNIFDDAEFGEMIEKESARLFARSIAMNPSMIDEANQQRVRRSDPQILVRNGIRVIMDEIAFRGSDVMRCMNWVRNPGLYTLVDEGR